MTLRDWFAGQALAGLCSNPEKHRLMRAAGVGDTEWVEVQSRHAYENADAMLAERAKSK